MIRRLLLFGVLLAVGGWLLSIIMATPGYSTVVWGPWSLEMKTMTLLLLVALACIVFYLLVRGGVQLLGLRQRFARVQQARRTGNAAQNLTQGLIQFAEGHWDKAEALLTQDVEHSDTPLINYLTAARAAHMQENPERRDELLRLAIASDNKAQIAVGVSRAEMQMADAQLEQAHATLINLRTLAPHNRYVLKLYAKTLFRQENWEQLLTLLPELQRHELLDNDSETMQRLKNATLRSVFAKYAGKEQADDLQTVWQQIPPAIKAQPAIKLLYAQALQRAGADDACAAFIVRSHEEADHADDKLTALYGNLQHSDHKQAITQAQSWLTKQPDNPANLLLLGRLYRAQQLPNQSGPYYVTSLNQSPDTAAYLELAEMLEAMGEVEKAAQCYRVGLRYSIHGKGERLEWKSNPPPLQVVG